MRVTSFTAVRVTSFNSVRVTSFTSVRVTSFTSVRVTSFTSVRVTSFTSVRVTSFTSTQQESCLCRHSALNGKVHLSFSNQPSYFLPQPAFSMSFLASPSSFDFQPQNPNPFLRRDHSLSSTHGPTNEHCLP